MKITEVYIYLRCHDGRAAVRYYTEVFGAKEKYRIDDPSNGRLGHAELELGPVSIMLSDEYPELDIRGPKSLGGTGCGIHLHVDDCDAFLARAEKAGGTIIRAASDQPHGERAGTVRDPFGHEWLIGHTIEEMSPEEMQKRYDAL